MILLVAVGPGCEAPAPRAGRPAGAERHQPAAPAAPTASGRAEEADVVAAAGPSSASIDALSDAERRRFREAVRRGRQRHGERDYDEAMRAFGDALDVLPDDPRTLSELGWAAVHAGRLDEAESALRRADSLAPDDERLRASILYNRGRLAEARGDDSAAIDAYQRSLLLRPHPSTYRRLHGIEGGTRYVFGPVVHPIQGPYVRLAEFCAEERRLTVSQRADEDAESFACLPDAAGGLGAGAVEVSEAGRLPSPWSGLRFVETRPNPYSVRFHAALETGDGWFVLPDVASLARGAPGTHERVTRLRARPEALFDASPPVVVVEVETDWATTEGDEPLESETYRVEFFCGIGESGRPSCTGALPRANRVRRRERGRVERTRWVVRRTVRSEGVVVLEGDAAAVDRSVADVLGAHRVAFL